MNELFVIFVPYEESLQLKDLGFDESTLYHWHNSCKTHPFTNEVFNPNCRPRTNSAVKSIGEENHVWSAPTFSQAFKFFRDKYKLVAYIVPFYCFESNDYKYNYLILHNKTNITDGELETNYNIAELECLRKLIEICKSTN